jgi:alanine racemase
MKTSKMRLQVDYGAIKRNALRVRQAIGQNPDGSPVRIYACLKANAYGFGARAVASALVDVVDGFQIGSIDDALEIKDIAGDKPVLLLATTSPADAMEAAASGIIITVYNDSALRACIAHNGHLNLAILVNSGLERLGVPADDLTQATRQLIDAGHSLKGIYTHIPFKRPDAKTWARSCMDRFESAVQKAMTVEGVPADIFIQARASSWVGTGMAANDNSVSIGHLLFGFTGHTVIPALSGLESPLRGLLGTIIDTHAITSDAASYKGSYYSTGMPSRVAIVAAGLTSGLTPPQESPMNVLVGGTIRKVVGISLENLIIDISAPPEVNIGDEVIICSDTSAGDGLSLRDLADARGMTQPQLAFLFSKLNVIEDASIPG